MTKTAYIFFLYPLAIIVALFVVSRKMEHPYVKKISFALALLFTGYLILTLGGARDWFRRFPDAETAFQTVGKGEIDCFLEGEESYWILYRPMPEKKPNTYTTFIGRKTEKGYTVDRSIFSHLVEIHKFITDKSVTVIVERIHVLRTEDRYIRLTIFSDDLPIVSDNAGSKFYVYHQPTMQIHAVAYLQTIPEHYTIWINGEEIPVT